MCATWVLESLFQAPIRCGFFLENCFTDAGARRSEFPCRSTGFTALPRTLAYRAWISLSASVFGSSG
jgi:hypothetical protein